MTIAAQATSPVKVLINQVVQVPAVPIDPTAQVMVPMIDRSKNIRRDAGKKVPITLPN